MPIVKLSNNSGSGSSGIVKMSDSRIEREKAIVNAYSEYRKNQKAEKAKRIEDLTEEELKARMKAEREKKTTQAASSAVLASPMGVINNATRKAINGEPITTAAELAAVDWDYVNNSSATKAIDSAWNYVSENKGKIKLSVPTNASSGLKTGIPDSGQGLKTGLDLVQKNENTFNIKPYEPKTEEEKKLYDKYYESVGTLKAYGIDPDNPESYSIVRKQAQVIDKYRIDPAEYNQEEFAKWAVKNGYTYNLDTGWRPTGKTSKEAREDFDILKYFADTDFNKGIAIKHPTLSSVGTVVTSPARSIAGAMAVVDDAIDTTFGGEINPYSRFHSVGNNTNTIRQTVGDEYASKWFGGTETPVTGNLGKFTYDTLMSAGDNVVNLLTAKAVAGGFGLSAAKTAELTSKITSGLMSSGAAADSIANAKLKGYTDEQALTLGIATGITEYLTEKIPLDNILKTPKTLVKGMLVGFASEGLEEGVSNWANKLTDYIIAGEDSDISMAIEGYVSEGKSKKDAILKAIGDSLLDDTRAMLSGGFSGMGMSAAYHSGNRVKTNIFGRKIANGKYSDVTLNDVINKGMSYEEGSDIRKKAEQLEAMTNGNTKKSQYNYKVGELAMDILSDDEFAFTPAGKIESARKLTEEIDKKVNLSEEGKEEAFAIAALGDLTEAKLPYENIAGLVKYRTDDTVSKYRESTGRELSFDKIFNANLKAVASRDGVNISDDVIMDYADAFAQSIAKDSAIYTALSEKGDDIAKVIFDTYMQGVSNEDSQTTKYAMERFGSLISELETNSLDMHKKIYGEPAESSNTETAESSNTELTNTVEEGTIEVTENEVDISPVVNAMGDTLRNGALQAVSAYMQRETGAQDWDVFARKVIENYRATGSIGEVSKYFTDGGKAIIEAIENIGGNTNERNGLLHEHSSRDDGSSGEQVGEVQGASEEVGSRRQTAEKLRSEGRTEQVNITKDIVCEVIKEDSYTDDMREVADFLGKYGLTARFMVGEGVNTKKGVTFTGAVTGDNVAYIQYDNTENTPETIAKHEIGHVVYKFAIGKKIGSILTSSFSKAELENILSKDRYAEYTDLYDGDINKVFEEFVCDTLAGMNEYTLVFDELVTSFWNNDFAATDNYDVSQYAEDADAGEIKYSLFPGGVFPPFNKSHSDANERATRWAHDEDIETGAQRIFFYKGSPYLVEKFDSMDLGYLVVEKLKKNDLERHKRRKNIVVEEDYDGKNRGLQPRREGTVSNNGQNRSVDESARRGPDDNNSSDRHNRETAEVQGLDREQDGKRSAEHDRSRDNEHSIEDREENVRFNLSKPVEETKDLIAVHNVSPEKLLKTLKLGGLPMPSIAIARAREGYNNFGEISLVFGKDTIDPQARGNHVYSGDAWTPTYPQISYKVKEETVDDIRKKINDIVPKNIQDDLGGLHIDKGNLESELNRHGDMVTSYRYNTAMKYAYLADNGANIVLPTKEETFYSYDRVSNNAVASFAHKMVDGLNTVNSLLEQHSSKLMGDTELINGITEVLNEDVLSKTDKSTPEYQKLIQNPLYKAEDIDLSTVLEMLEAARKYFHANGKAESRIDYRSARGIIDNYFSDNDLQNDYEVWVKELFSNVVEKEGIRNNKDLFTPSGNRRSFEALHYEHTLENVVKAMKEQGDRGIGGFGGGNIFGAATTEYTSVEDIKTDAENRLHQLPESKYDEIKKGFSDRLFELAQSLPIHKDSFTAVDDAANMLIDAVSKYKTKSGMANYIRSESKGWANYNDYIVDDLIQLVNEIRQMPVGYFEAKPQRAVEFEEIKAVIMPAQESFEDDLSEVKGELEKLDVPVIEYEYGDNNDRVKALNSVEDVRFSVSKKNEGDLNGKEESRNAQRMGDNGTGENRDSIWKRSDGAQGIYTIMGEQKETLQRSDGETGYRYINWSRVLGDIDVYEQSEKEYAYGIIRKISQTRLSGIDNQSRSLTSEQQNYFADSMAKDSSGNLLTLYHATDNSFDEFTAGDFAYHVGVLPQAMDMDKKYIKEVYIDLRNPIFIAFDACTWTGRDVAFEAIEQNIISREEYDTLSSMEGFDNNDSNSPANMAIKKLLKEKGYDGIVYRNDFEARGLSFMLFDSNQIKYTSNKKPSSSSNLRFSVSTETQDRIEKIKDKYSDKMEHLYITEREDTISIDNMVVKEEYRNRGIGTAILTDIIDYADDVGKTITLTPTTEFGTKERLKKWYKSHGFVENKGKQTDFLIRDTMYRLPQDDIRFSVSKQPGVMWTMEQGVLNKNEVSAFYSKVSELRNNKYHNYVKSSDGEYIFAIENKMVFTDGDYDYPEISRVVTLNADNETEADTMRRLFYDLQKSGNNIEDALSIIEYVYGQGAVTQANIGVSGTNENNTGRAEGSNGTTPDSRSGEDVKLSVATETQDRITEIAKNEVFIIPEGVTNNLSNQIDRWLKGEMTSNEMFEFGNTPAVLKELGAEDLPVVMSQNTMVKLNGEKHDVSLENIRNLPQNLADPLMVFKSATVPNAYIVLTSMEDMKGDTIVVALHLNKTENRLKVNRVASIYGKYNVAKFVAQQTRLGNLKYIDEIKSQEWSTSRGLQLPKLVQSNPDNNSILEKEDIVKKYSAKHEQKNSADDVKLSIVAKEENDKTVNEDELNRQWDKAVEDYGSIEPGANPIRDIRVPKKSDKNKYVSKSARTLLEAEIMPDNTVDDFRREVINHKVSHIPITDKDARKYAFDKINEFGFDGAIQYWNALAAAENVPGKNDIVLGEVLLNQCLTAADVELSMKIAADLAHMATRSGQATQAFSMIKKMSPDGKLYCIEKSVQSLNREMKEQLGKKGKDLEIELNKDLARRYLTETDEISRQQLLDEIHEDIAKQIPATGFDKWTAWRYLSMLGNPRTHFRNVVGNAIMVPTRKLKNFIGAVLEGQAIAHGKMEDSQRTKAIIRDKSALEFAKNDFDKVGDLIKGYDGKYDIKYGEINERRQIFKNRFLEAVRRFNNDAMEWEDGLFLRAAYVDALAQVMTARNITPEFLNSGTREAMTALDNIRKYAIKEAQEATFRDANELAKAMNKGRRWAAKQGGATKFLWNATIEGILPFKNTPLNIAKRGIEYSPAYLIKGLTYDVKAVINGKITTDQMLDNIAKGFTGTALMLMGVLLAHLGWIIGVGDDDKKKRKFDETIGFQGYALKLGEFGTYTIDWAAPTVMPIFVGVELWNSVKDDEMSFADFTGAMSKVAEPLMELSCLQGISSVLETVTYYGDNAISAVFIDAATSYIMQAVPTLSGQIARTADKTRRTIYVNKNSHIPHTIQTLAQQTAAKMPAVSYMLEPRLDAWGREMTYGENIALRGMSNFVSPGYARRIDNSKVSKELNALYERVGDNSVFPIVAQKSVTISQTDVKKYSKITPGKINLTGEQYTFYAKSRGQNSLELVTELINSPNYKNKSDEEKVEAIKDCYTEAGKNAKIEFIEKYLSDEK